MVWLIRMIVALSVLGFTIVQQLSAEPVPINIESYATRNIATYLFPTFPTGKVVPPLNTFGVPFLIPNSGSNFFTIETIDQPFPVHIGVPGVVRVYTLIQAYGPHAGDKILTVEFNGSAGASQKFSLIVGEHVRDFFESNFSRTINNTTTRTAFECIGRGGAYTDDVTTGPRGFYNFDEQEFVLDPIFATQTLDNITFTRHTQYGTPMILGITAVNGVGPETPFYRTSRFWLIAGIGLTLLAILGVVVWIRRWLDAP